MKHAPTGALTRASLLACATLCASTSLHAAADGNGNWILDGNGTWSATANWADTDADTIGDIADGVGTTADFSTIDFSVGAKTVTVDSARTVGALDFGDTDLATLATWALAGAAPNSLTLATSSGKPTITTQTDTNINAGFVLTGTNGFSKEGAGVLRFFSNATTLTGDIHVNGGTLAVNRIGGNGSATATIGTGAIVLANGTTFRMDSAGNTFLNNAISLATGADATLSSASAGNGYGGLVTGDATATLNIVNNANQAFALGASTGAGTPQLANFAGLVKITAGNALRFSSTSGPNGNGSANATFQVDGNIFTRNAGGAGGVVLGALTGSGTLSGQTNTAVGTVIYNVGAKGLSTTFAGTFVNGGQGTSGLNKHGAGTLTLTGDSPGTGNFTVTAGTLAIGDGGTTGSTAAPAIAVASGANLVFNTSGTQNTPGIISGDGSITKQGSGRTNLTGANTYTANTVIQGGTIAINADSGLGNAAGSVNFTSGSGKIMSSAAGVTTARTFNISPSATGGFAADEALDSLQVDGSVNGNGALEIGGSGVVTLTQDQTATFSGGTTVVSGTLSAANAAGSATGSGPVAVNGGILGGSGAVAGAVSVASGAGLKPGAITPVSSAVDATGLGVGSLSLAGGSTLYLEFANASTYDKVVSAGALTHAASLANPIMVDLRLENSVANFSALGTYTLIEHAGFVGNANDLFEITPGSAQSGVTYTFNNTGTAITVTLSGTAPSEWNVDAAGTWATAGNWANGVPNNSAANAVLGTVITAPRAITLGAPATIGTLTFNNANAYAIGGASTLTFNNGVNNAELNVILGNHEINAPVSLNDPLEIVFGHATDSVALNGVISGSVGIVKAGTGELTLGGNNLFNGLVDFSGGKLTFANGGLGLGNLALNGTTLAWAPGNMQDISGRVITFGADDIAFDTNGNDVVLAGNIGGFGSAPFVKTGFGKLTLAADTNFSGAITITEGSLQLGNGGTTGAVIGDILNNAELAFSRSGDAPFNNAISGTGSVIHHGPGTLQLGAANTFTGTTTITGGTIALFNGFALQNSTLSYQAAGGTLDFDFNGAATLGGLTGDKDLVLTNAIPGPVDLTVGGNNESTTYTGAFSGTGSLIKAGTGTLTLAGGAHTYAGATTVNAGILELQSGSIATTTANTGIGGRLQITGGSLTASGFSTYQNGGVGVSLVSGSLAFDGGVQSSQNDGSLLEVWGGTFTALDVILRRTQNYGTGADPVPAAAGNGGFVVNGGTATIANTLQVGTGNSSAGALVNGGDLSVAGVVTVGNSTNDRWCLLEVRSGTFTATEAAQGIVLSPHPVNTNRAQFLVTGGTATVERIGFGDPLGAAGTGRVTVTGGELYVGSSGLVQAAPAFTSQVQLFGGTLGAKASWSSSLNVVTANTFTIQTADASAAPFDITLSGAVTGTGSLVKSGAGTLTLSGAHAYTGSTEIHAGTLVLSAATLADTATLDVSSTGSGVLHLPHGQVDVVADYLIDGVSQGPGLYTAANSGGRITGTGSIQVIGADPYNGWISGFSVGGLTAKTDDPDGDGLTNVEEFGLDGNPASGAATGKVRSRIETVGAEQALVITLPVRDGAVFAGATSKSATVDDLVYTVEGTNNLSAFDQGVTEIAVSSAGMPPLTTGWSYRSFRLDGAIGGGTPRGPRGFLAATVADAP